MKHVAQRNQSGAMLSRDRGRRATYRGVADREQGGKLFRSQLFLGALCHFYDHDRSMDYFLQSRVVYFDQAENKDRLSLERFSSGKFFSSALRGVHNA
jgi:hypothetical protein